jgi:hypothetical protein
MPIFLLLSNTYIIRTIYYLTTSCYCLIEKGAFTPKAPRWKVDGRQSSSVSVLLPTGARRGVSEAGIDSVAEFRVWCSTVIHDSKHLARPPQKGGWAVAIFIFLITPLQPKCVPWGRSPTCQIGFVWHFSTIIRARSHQIDNSPCECCRAEGEGVSFVATQADRVCLANFLPSVVL